MSSHVTWAVLASVFLAAGCESNTDTMAPGGGGTPETTTVGGAGGRGGEGVGGVGAVGGEGGMGGTAGAGGSGGDPQLDTDGDGITDAIENAVGLDPLDPDTDDDGLLDGEEDFDADGVLDPWESNPADPDSDGDGWCDRARVDNDGDGIDPADACSGSEVLHVDQTAAAGGNGLTWASAYDDLSAAMAAASAGQQLWLAQGTYVSATETDTVLTLVDAIDLHGGFVGTENVLLQRTGDPALTVLSGDVNGDDPTVTDNSHKVLVGTDLTTGVLITSLTIRAATPLGLSGGGMRLTNSVAVLDNIVFADNDAGSVYAAALFSSGSDVTVRNSTFSGNTAVQGGAIYAHAGSVLTMENVVLSNNSATEAAGALALHGGSTLNLDTVTFLHNDATLWAGALDASTSTVTATATVFVGNVAVTSGGAVNTYDNSAAFTDSAFVANVAQDGGAYASENSFESFSDSAFVGNTAASEGGGGTFTDGTFTCNHVSFTDNSAEHPAYGDGGALALYGIAPDSISNASFYGNDAAHFGGAIASDGTLSLTNVSVRANTASNTVAVYSFSSMLFIANGAFWDGSQGIAGFDTAQVDNTCYPVSQAGTGNVILASDPFEAAPASGELFLTTTSPCLGIGDDIAANKAGIPWATLTTQLGAGLDASPVDAGAHHHPQGARVATFSVDGDDVTWTTVTAASCRLYESASGTLSDVATADTQLHTWPSLTRVALVCVDAAGHPTAATGTVP